MPSLIFNSYDSSNKSSRSAIQGRKRPDIICSPCGWNAGDKLNLEVLLADADGKLSVGIIVKDKVKAEIVDQVKGDTVIAYKQKRRKGFRKKKGHRTAYTKIKVTSIA